MRKATSESTEHAVSLPPCLLTSNRQPHEPRKARRKRSTDDRRIYFDKGPAHQNQGGLFEQLAHPMGRFSGVTMENTFFADFPIRT